MKKKRAPEASSRAPEADQEQDSVLSCRDQTRPHFGAAKIVGFGFGFGFLEIGRATEGGGGGEGGPSVSRWQAFVNLAIR